MGCRLRGVGAMHQVSPYIHSQVTAYGSRLCLRGSVTPIVLRVISTALRPSSTIATTGRT